MTWNELYAAGRDTEAEEVLTGLIAAASEAARPALLRGLAKVRVALGRRDEARKLLEEAVASAEGDELVEAKRDLAQFHLDAGLPTLAAPLFFEVFTAVQEKRGGSDVATALVLRDLARALLSGSSFARANELLSQVATFLRSKEGANDPEYGATLVDLATLFTRLGETEEARPFVDEALRIAEASAPGSIRHAEALECRADWHAAREGEAGLAIPFLEQAIEMRSKCEVRPTVGTAGLLFRLATFHAMNHAPRDVVRPVAERALRMTERTLGAASTEAGMIRQLLA